MDILHDEIVYDGKFIRTLRRHYLDAKGEEKVWEMVERKTKSRIVGIAAITPEREIILEKSFRIPAKSYVLELPAGLPDRKGESEEELARRELLEETGYEVDEVKFLIGGCISAGIITDELSLYLGTNARRVKEPELEPSEDIEVIKVPLNRLPEYLLETINRGEINPALDRALSHSAVKMGIDAETAARQDSRIFKGGVKIDVKITAFLPFIKNVRY